MEHPRIATSNDATVATKMISPCSLHADRTRRCLYLLCSKEKSRNRLNNEIRKSIADGGAIEDTFGIRASRCTPYCSSWPTDTGRDSITQDRCSIKLKTRLVAASRIIEKSSGVPMLQPSRQPPSHETRSEKGAKSTQKSAELGRGQSQQSTSEKRPQKV